MPAQRSTILVTAKDETRDALASVRNGMAGLVRGVQTAGAAFGSFLGYKIVQQTVAAGKAIVDARVEVDRLRNVLSAGVGADKVASELKFVTDAVAKLGLPLIQTAESYAKMTASAQGTVLAGAQTRDIFMAVAKASTAMHLSGADTEGVLRAIQQIMSKGTVQAEELRGQLGDRLPGAFAIASRAMGMTQSQFGSLMEQGLIPAAEFLPKFAAALEKEFGGAAERASTSMAAALNRLETATKSWKQGIALGPAGDVLAVGISKTSEVIQREADDMRDAAAGAQTFGGKLAWLAAFLDPFSDSMKLLAKDTRAYADELDRLGKRFPAPPPIATQAQIRALDNSLMGQITFDSNRALDKLKDKFKSPEQRRKDDIAEARRLAGLTGRDVSDVIKEIERRGQSNEKTPFQKLMEDYATKSKEAGESLEKLREKVEGFWRGDIGKQQGLIDDLVARREGLGMVVKPGDKDGQKGLVALDERIAAERERLELLKQEADLMDRKAAYDANIAEITKQTDAYRSSADAVKQELKSLTEENQFRDLTKAQIEDIRIARLNEKLAMESGVDGSAEVARALTDEIRLREKLRDQYGIQQARDDELAALKAQTDDTAKTARDLGLTFKSAAEDAIVEFKDLRSVIQGLGQDLWRLWVRKNVTEPLLGGDNSIWSSALSWVMNLGGTGEGSGAGYDYASEAARSVPASMRRAKGGPVWAGGMFQVLEEGRPEMLTIGGRNYLMAPGSGYVTPLTSGGGAGGGVSLTQNISIASGVDESMVYRAMSRAKAEAVAAVRDSMNRGGWAAQGA